MASLSEAIETLFPLAVNDVNFKVSDDGTGPRITYWEDSLGPLPTSAQLNAVTQEQVDAAKDAKEASEKPLQNNLRKRVNGFINTIQDYEAITAPTNAQTIAFAKAMAPMMRVALRAIKELSNV